MKLYLAGAAREQLRVKQVAERLAVAGHEITSSWLGVDVGVGTAPERSDADIHTIAMVDLADVARADALVHVVPLGERDARGRVEYWLHTGGRHVETGYALALHKPVLVIGALENIFQRGLCRAVLTVGQACEELRELEKELKK